MAKAENDTIATLRRELDEARAQVAALKAEVNAGRAMWSAGAACDNLERDDPLMKSATDNLMSTIGFYDEIKSDNEAKGIG